ncbi:hypothetical protein BDN70DRAFT_877972 [Pholiota conissans]|uniref:Uncharacterized protein n=1 Tax=Pholiota conissans TaxID=109636 RepID=A0A9P5Z2T4_9AGAR|nr:hypothetical protein BDN70DRAFT_877972 [Pholiota conissans]
MLTSTLLQPSTFGTYRPPSRAQVAYNNADATESKVVTIFPSTRHVQPLTSPHHVNTNETSDAAELQHSKTRYDSYEREGDQHSTPNRTPDQGPVVLEAFGTSNIDPSNLENKVRQHAEASSNRQRSEDRHAQLPTLPVEVQKSRTNYSKQVDSHIPGPHNTTIASFVKVEYTQSFPRSSHPKNIQQAMPNVAQVSHEASQNPRIPATPAQLSRNAPFEIQRPSLRTQDPAHVAEISSIAPLEAGKIDKDRNNDDDLQNPIHARQPPLKTESTQLQALQLQQDVIFPVQQFPSVMVNKGISQQNFTDTENRASHLDARKIENTASNSSTRQQETVTDAPHEKTARRASHFTTPQASFITPLNDQEKTPESRHEGVGWSISRPATRIELRPDHVGQIPAHGQRTPIKKDKLEVPQPGPIALFNASSSGSNKGYTPTPGTFQGHQILVAEDEYANVKNEPIQKVEETPEAMVRNVAASIFRPPTSMGFQSSTQLQLGDISRGYQPSPIRVESSLTHLVGNKESPGRRRNDKLDSPYKAEVSIPQTPTGSQSKQDSPGYSHRILNTPSISRPTVLAVVDHTRMLNSSNQESPRTQLNTQFLTADSPFTRVVEDLLFPMAKATSKQGSPLLPTKQTDANPRVPEKDIEREQVVKSLSSIPIGSSTNPVLPVSRQPPYATPRQDPTTEPVLPNPSATFEYDVGPVHQTSLVGNITRTRVPSNQGEAVRPQLPQDIIQNASSGGHPHNMANPQPVNRRERPSPLLDSRANSHDFNKPSPIRSIYKQEIVDQSLQADPPSLGFFTTNFEDALIKATHEKSAVVSSQEPSETIRGADLDVSRQNAQVINEQSMKQMMKRYELQSNVTDSKIQPSKPERIHSRQASTEQYRSRKDSGDRLDPTRLHKITTSDDQPTITRQHDEPDQHGQITFQEPRKAQQPHLADLLSPTLPSKITLDIQDVSAPLPMKVEVARQRTLSSSSNRNVIPPSELIKTRDLLPAVMQPDSSRHPQFQKYPADLPRDVSAIQEIQPPPARSSTAQPPLPFASVLQPQQYPYEVLPKSTLEPGRQTPAPDNRVPFVRPQTTQPQPPSAIQRDAYMPFQGPGETQRQNPSQIYTSELQKNSVDQIRNPLSVQDTRSKGIGTYDTQGTTSIQPRETPFMFPTEPSRHLVSQRHPSDFFHKQPEPLQRPVETLQRPSESNRNPLIAQESRPSAFRTYLAQPSLSSGQGRETHQHANPSASTSRIPSSSLQAQTSTHPPLPQRDAPAEGPISGRREINPSSRMEQISSQDRRTNAAPVPLSLPTSQYSIRHQHSASLPSTSASMIANASSQEIPRSATPAQAYHKMSTLQSNPPVHASIEKVPSFPKAPSEETILLTPSSLARSAPLKPTTSRQSVTPSVASQSSRKGGGFFNVFKKSTTTPNPPQQYEIWRPTGPVKTPDSSPKAMQSEPEPDTRRMNPRPRRDPPPPISIPVPIHGIDQKKSNVFTPFKYLTTRRNRGMSVASLEAQDGTAPNTVVGSPTASMHSQAPIQPPPWRDPRLATEEWRDNEEAGLQKRSKAKVRRQRPGVVFDVEEEHPDDIKRRPRRVKTKHRSSSKQTGSSQPGPSQS